MAKPNSSVNPSENSLPKLSSEEQKSPKNINQIKSDVEMAPPDGGWGWMIVIGSLIITVKFTPYFMQVYIYNFIF